MTCDKPQNDTTGIVTAYDEKKIRTELAQTKKELKKLKKQIASLELKKAKLLADLDDLENND